MGIQPSTRKNIFDYLRVGKINWAGRLEEPDFLERVFDLDNMGSYDGRFQNAKGDIWQHRINNYDWPDDWVFSDERFNLLRCKDEIFLKFLCETIHPVVRSDSEQIDSLQRIYNDLLKEEGYEIVTKSDIAGQPVYTALNINEDTLMSLRSAKQSVEVFDATYLARQIQRLEKATHDDPELAIGTAKELIESCCKTILEHRNVAYNKNSDLPQLVKATITALKLVPDQIQQSKKTEDVVRKLLGNLTTVGQSITELRNLHGTGHGRNASHSGLEKRHAKLVVGSAITLAVFLYETHEDNKANGVTI